MNERRKILVCYDYFDPAYKAGGPIRSLLNLIYFLGQELKFYVITGDSDHDGSRLEVCSDAWVDHPSGASVIYLSGKKRNYKCIDKLIGDIDPHIVYINGMFSVFSFVYPMLVCRFRQKEVIVAPRGMLQKGSLSQKRIKKMAYLNFMKLIIPDKVKWQLTTPIEFDDFSKVFPQFITNTAIIGNVPTIKETTNKVAAKNRNQIIIGTIALVGPMKNHHLVLEALKLIDREILYLIYGPIHDKQYWNDCMKLIQQLPDNIIVEYKGELPPEKVQSTLTSFHYYIQPSKSENFGHSIFEALSVGVPVITSKNTPWRSLKQKKAGWNIDTSDIENLTEVLRESFQQSAEEYDQFSVGALNFSEKYLDSLDLRTLYMKLFS